MMRIVSTFLLLFMFATVVNAQGSPGGGSPGGGSSGTDDYTMAQLKKMEAEQSRTFVDQSEAATLSTKMSALQAFDSAWNARSLCTDPAALAAGDALLNSGYAHYGAGENGEDQAGVESWLGDLDKSSGDFHMNEWEYAEAIFDYEDAIDCYADSLMWHDSARSGYQLAKQRYDEARVAYLTP